MKSRLLNLKRHFTTIPNALINDNELSTQARFLFVFLASKPDDWEFYQDNLCKALQWSGDTFRKYAKELQEAGWIDRHRIKDEQQRFSHYQYTLHSEPVRKKASSEKSQFGNFPNWKKSAYTKKYLNKEVFKTKEVVEETSPHFNDDDPRRQKPKPIKSNQELYDAARTDQIWKEFTCKNNRLNSKPLKPGTFDKLLEYFYQLNTAQSHQWHSLKDFKSHFNNYLRTAPIGDILKSLNQVEVRRVSREAYTPTEEERAQMVQMWEAAKQGQHG